MPGKSPYFKASWARDVWQSFNEAPAKMPGKSPQPKDSGADAKELQ